MTLTNGKALASASPVSEGQSEECPKATKNEPDPQIIIGILAELFQETFVAENWRPHRPLKVGIANDLVERGVLQRSELQ
jgi:sRNA-binding protein